MSTPLQNQAVHLGSSIKQGPQTHTPGPWFIVQPGGNGNWPGGCEIAIDDRDGGNEERDYFLASAVHGDPDELLANARLIAAAPELLEALQWHEQFKAREGEDGTSFERVAENFHRATGYLAPGKDCRVHSPEVRQAAWDQWIAEGVARTRAALAKATGESA